MENSKFINVIGEFFGVHEHDDCVELETWTSGGVNMIITLLKDSDETLIEQFGEYVENFDTDEEIDVHRQDQRYKNAFTISQSVHDFETFGDWLQEVLEKIEE